MLILAVEISAPGFESANTTVVLAAGDVEAWSPRMVSAEAPPTPEAESDSPGPAEAPAEGRIRLLGDLPGSYRVTVRGEGTDRTFSTSNIPLAPGEYQVGIEADGYAPAEFTVRIEGRLAALGFAGFLQKPFRFQELKDAIGAAIRSGQGVA